MRWPWWLPFGSVPEIEAAQLAQQLEAAEPIQLLDVRTHAEFERSHIAGSRHVPITELRGVVGNLPLQPSVRTVAICLSGHRSIPAVRVLHRHGFEQAMQLAGGMKAWWAAGLPVEGAG